MDGLKDRFEGFGKEPSEVVWEGINAALDAQKPTRKMWYYWAAALIVIGAGIGYFSYTNYTTETLPIVENTTNKSTDTISNEIEKTRTTDNQKTKNDADSEHDIAKTDIHKMNKVDDTISPDKKSEKRNNVEPIRTVLNSDKELAKQNTVPKNELPQTNKTVNSNTYSPEISINTPPTNIELDQVDLSLNSTDNIADKTNNATLLSQNVDGSSEESFGATNIGIDNMSLLELSSLSNDPDQDIIHSTKELNAIKKNKWSMSVFYNQGLLTYQSVTNESYYSDIVTLINPIEILQLVSVKSTILHHQPQWLSLEFAREWNSNNSLIMGLEYGQMTSDLSQNEIILYKGTNKSMGFLLGMDHVFVKKSRLTLSSGIQALIGTQKTEWQLENVAEYDSYLNDSPAFSATENSSTNKSAMYYQAAYNINLGYHINEKISVHIRPFAKRYLLEEFPNSTFSNKPFQWGVGMGLRF